MKNKIIQQLLLICILFMYIQNLSAQNLDWAKSIGNLGYNEGSAITVDVSGNVYSTGTFSGTIDFDPGAGATNLTTTGSRVYIQKLDTFGNLVWVKSIGGTGFNNRGIAITVDYKGNVLVTGTTSGIVDYDPGIGTYNLTGGSFSDIFILKLDASGNFVWAKIMAGAYIDMGNSIVTDNTGNVYSTGAFTNVADFNPGPGIFNLTSHGTLDYDIFIQKLDSNGNFVWAKNMGSTSDDIGFGITIDNLGNLFSTGTFKGTVDFDPGIGTSDLISNGGTDIYVQNLDTAGNFIWAKNFGGLSNDYVQDIEIDNQGNIFTIGRFAGIADFDPAAITYNLTTAGSDYDFFIQKLNTSGDFVWAKSVGGTENDFGQSIAVDLAGNVYATGYYSGSPDFDPGVGTLIFTPKGGLYDTDLFILKLNSTGNFVQAVTVGSTQTDRGSSIAIDGSNNLYATGGFSGVIDFNPISLTSAGGTDIFIAKWNQINLGLENYFPTENAVIVYPNPANEKLTIELSNFFTQHNFNLIIFNNVGQVIKEVFIDSKLTTIGLDTISSGTYFYKLQADDKTLKVGKIIIE